MTASVLPNLALPFEETDLQPLLSGADPTPGVVAVDVVGETAILVRRFGDTLRREERPFRPWLLATETAPLAEVEWEELAGPGYRFRGGFRRWEAVQAARATLRQPCRPGTRPRSPAPQF